MHLAFAGVEAGADLDPECPERIADRRGSLDSASRPVEGGEEPVTGCVELPPLIPRKLAANDGVMPLKQFSPGRVADARGELGRADDIREEDRREHSLRTTGMGEARDEVRGRLHRRAVRLVIDPGVDTPEGRKIHELGAANPLRSEVAGPGKDGPWEDQGRNADGGKDVGDVELHRGAERRQRGAGAEAASHVPDEPVAEALVLGDLGRPFAGERVEIASLAPAGTDPGQTLPPLLLGRRPRVVGRARPLDPGVEQDEPSASLRIRRREQDAHAGARSARPEHGALRSDGVHHRPHVVHRRLDRRHLPDAIREPRPTLVEHQHPAARGEPLDVTDQKRLLPRRQQVAGDTTHEDDVRRASADDLVRDRDITAAGIAHVGRLHSPQYPRSRLYPRCAPTLGGPGTGKAQTQSPIPHVTVNWRRLQFCPPRQCSQYSASGRSIRRVTLSSSDVAAIRGAEKALADAFEAADLSAWVDFYTEDAIFVGPGMPAIEGRDALLSAAPSVVISSMEIVADSTLGAGDFAATQGRANWVSGPKGSDAPRVRRRFLMVWRREADGRWRIARELLNEDV